MLPATVYTPTNMVVAAVPLFFKVIYFFCTVSFVSNVFGVSASSMLFLKRSKGYSEGLFLGVALQL